MEIIGPAAKVADPTAELHHIECPYCGEGHGKLIVTVSDGGKTKQAQLRDPMRCNVCSRFFAAMAVTKFVGRKLEGG